MLEPGQKSQTLRGQSQLLAEACSQKTWAPADLVREQGHADAPTSGRDASPRMLDLGIGTDGRREPPSQFAVESPEA